jgi:predicted amidohydrolase
MRILLVAHNAAPGDIDLNLARHVAMLDQARVQGCDIAVFPEFSLTGSVNPSRHPERAVAIDAEPVQAMIQATWRTGVPAVFGIAEHLDGAFHISQVYGHSGRLGGVYANGTSATTSRDIASARALESSARLGTVRRHDLR